MLVAIGVLLCTALGACAFESREGGFTVDFPGKPSSSSHVLNNKMVAHWFTLEDTVHSYLVTYNDLPAGNTMTAAQRLDATETAIVKADKLVRKRDTTLNGYPERDLVVTSQNGVSLGVRMVVTPHRYDQVISGVKGAKVDGPCRKFLASFVLIKH